MQRRPEVGYTLDSKPTSMKGSVGEKKDSESQGISESGWTHYFNQSIDEYCDNMHTNSFKKYEKEETTRNKHKSDEEFSLVSDASSGTPKPIDDELSHE